MSTWENTRKHARALESRLESKLSAYSKLAAQISSRAESGASSSQDQLGEQEEGVGGYRLMEEEIEELLDKVSLPVVCFRLPSVISPLVDHIAYNLSPLAR